MMYSYTLKESGKDVSGLLSEVRKVTPFLGDYQGLMATIMGSAIKEKKVGLFALECLPSHPTHSIDGALKMGKAVDDGANLIESVPLLALREEVTSLTNILGQWGINVSIHVFLGDDDYKYSIDPIYENKHGVASMVSGMKELLETSLNGSVKSWAVTEQQNGLGGKRNGLKNALEVVVGSNLFYSRAVSDRYQEMLKWRTQYLQSEGVKVSNPDLQMLEQQALEELTNYLFQLAQVPKIIKDNCGAMPLVFLNTYPGLNQMDWGAIQWLYGQKLTEGKYPMLGFDGQGKQKMIAPACGDPTGWKGSKS